jgi:hypothetical protein
VLCPYLEWRHAAHAAAKMIQLSLTCEEFKRVRGHQGRALSDNGRRVATSKASGKVWTGAKSLLNTLHAGKVAS